MYAYALGFSGPVILNDMCDFIMIFAFRKNHDWIAPDEHIIKIFSAKQHVQWTQYSQVQRRETVPHLRKMRVSGFKDFIKKCTQPSQNLSIIAWQ